MNNFYTKKRENIYEILFITKKNDEEKIWNLKKKLSMLEVTNELEFKIWKEINPSYKIKDIEVTDKALYFIMKFECGKDGLMRIEEILKLSPEVRRYRTINLTKDYIKMKVGKIRNPKPKIKKKPYSRERFEKRIIENNSKQQLDNFKN